MRADFPHHQRPGYRSVQIRPGIYLKNGDRRLIMLYLSALQLMAFANRPAARLAFDAIREQDIPAPARGCPPAVLRAVFRPAGVPSEPDAPVSAGGNPERDEQNNKLGFYDPVIRESLNEICRRACICLQNGERQGFVNGFSTVTAARFSAFAGFLAEEGMIGPDEVPVPD